MNPQWIAFADKQGKAAIFCEETRLRLDSSRLAIQAAQAVSG
jgi:hypothetical protein